MAEQTIGKLLVELLLQDEGFQEGLNDASKQTAGFAKVVDDIGNKLGSALVTGFKAATTAVVGFTAASAVVGAQFEQQIQTVAALKGITDKTAESYQKIEERARELGGSTAFSATEAATAMQDLARSGMSVDAMVSTIGPALEFAGAAGSTLTQSTKLLSATLAQFSLGAAESGRISDVYATALAETQFSTESLAQAMKQAGPVGAAFGQDLEAVTTVVAQFKNLGLEGSQAGTVYKAMLASLAKPTDEAAAALQGLGLTTDQVNPSMNSMVDILHTLADAGLSIDESLSIFGRRFGGAVSSVVTQTSEGVGGMDELLVKLQSSAGNAATMYETMQNTVSGQFEILKSAVEELMLSTFDTFSGPLTDLLRELSATIQAVATEFAKRSGDIGASLEENIGSAIQWLQDNRLMIVETFVNGAEAVTDLAVSLATLLPLLDEVASVLAVVFAVSMAQKLGVAISALVTGVGALQLGFQALLAQVVAATGGVFAFVLMIGTLVAALAALAKSYSDAEKAAKSLEDQQRASLAVTEEAGQKILRLLGKEIDASKVLESQKRKELAAAGQLTQIRREELDLIRDSTKEELALAIARGQIIEHAGELRTVASLYQEIEEDALPAVTAKLAQLRKQQVGLVDESGRLKELKDGLDAGSAATAELVLKTRGFAGGMDELIGKIDGLDTQIQTTAGAIKNLTQENEEAQVSLLETYADKVPNALGETENAFVDVGDAAADAAAKADAAWADAADRAMASAARIRGESVRGLEDILADQEQALSLSHQRELADLQASQDEALALVQDNLVARGIVEQQFAQARTNIIKRQAIEANQAEIKAQNEALAKKVAGHQKTLAARKSTLDAIKGMERAGLSESQRIEADRTAFFIAHANVTAQERLKAEAFFQAEIKKARKSETSQIKDVGAAVVESAQAVMGAGSAIIQGFVGASKKAFGVGKKVLEGLTQLGKKAAKVAGTIFSSLTGGFSMDAVGIIKDALSSIASGESGGSVGDVAVQFVEEMAANASTIVAGIVEALPMVVEALISALPGVIDAVLNALPVVIGVILEAIPQIVSIIADKLPGIIALIAEQLPLIIETLAAQLPILIGVIAENLPNLIAALADALPMVVEALAGAIPLLIQVVAENLPTIISTLAGLLPMVVQIIADNLPSLIEIIVGQVPVAIQAIVTALPILIGAIIDSLPFIVDALLTAVPILISGIVGALPALIMGLLNGILELIPMLIAQIPVIITALMELLPEIIISLLDAIPGIITAIIEAIPTIILAILGALPKIITSLIQAIPEIILSLVTALPDLISQLILAILNAIPLIIVALVKALFVDLIPMIPVLVFELVKALAIALWDLVKGIGQFFKDLFSRDKDKDKSSAYSGINYVPATMRGVTLHAGEAVLTADENQRRQFGGAAGSGQANPSTPVVSTGQGGQSTSVEAFFAVDGRVVDRVLIRANENGQGQTTRMMKRMAGVRSGIGKGRFKRWSK